MTQAMHRTNSQAPYEYKEVTVHSALAGRLMTQVRHLGWTLEKSESVGPRTTMRLRRDKALSQRGDLHLLQLQFESLTREMDKLERAKTRRPSALAYLAGMTGTVFLAGAVVALLGGFIPPCIMLSLAGVAGWILAPILYRTIKMRLCDKVGRILENRWGWIDKISKTAHGIVMAIEADSAPIPVAG